MTDPAPPREPTDRTLPPDDAARAMARSLLAGARHAALSFLDPASGTPGISRIAHGRDAEGVSIALVSGLTAHAPALRLIRDCALLLGDVPPRGDPLVHPRLMLRARAEFAPAEDRAMLRALWLAQHPKAAVYVDLADFAFVRFHPVSALLNAGFARAFRLAAADLLP
ncbi:MAG: pyridoxamine 5-phosphate oxidase [Paracoccaceae bacterium]|nr:MAG: pyridoxamine 5-phosphate oxidase [Paracoccaceae bacterium]